MNTNRRVADGRRSAAPGRHIAVFLPDLEGGGAQQVMLKLAAAFAHGRRVDLVLVRRKGALAASVPSEVRVVELGGRGVLAALPALVRYLRHERPEVAVSTLPHANIGLVWARMLARVRTRVFIREATTRSQARAIGLDLRRRILPAAIALVYPRADGIVAVSEGVAEDLRRRFRIPAERVHVIANPIVDEELFDRAEEALDDPWFVPDAPPVILGVGRLNVEKGFDTLLDAFAVVRARRHVRLLLLGEGPQRAMLEQRAARLMISSDVRMPGYVQNPLRYMARSSVFVLSSRREGLPGALIQALACGCPVVSTDCPSGPAEVLAGGRFGRLVPVGDSVAMADAIDLALDEPLERDLAIGRSRAYSVAASVQAYEALFGRSGAAR